MFRRFKINKPNLNNLYKQLKHPPALLCCRTEIVSGFLQGLGLSMLQNQSTTSHYNFPVEHKWGSPSVASGNKDESLLALVSSNYLQTSLSHHFSPFQCGWIFECRNSPFFLSFSRVTGWEQRIVKTQMGLNFPKFHQIPFFPPSFSV